jgi:hypothetical protein
MDGKRILERRCGYCLKCDAIFSGIVELRRVQITRWSKLPGPPVLRLPPLKKKMQRCPLGGAYWNLT